MVDDMIGRQLVGQCKPSRPRSSVELVLRAFGWICQGGDRSAMDVADPASKSDAKVSSDV